MVTCSFASALHLSTVYKDVLRTAEDLRRLMVRISELDKPRGLQLLSGASRNSGCGLASFHFRRIKVATLYANPSQTLCSFRL